METTTDMDKLRSSSPGGMDSILARRIRSAAFGRDVEQIGERMVISTLRAPLSRRGIPTVDGIVGFRRVLPIAYNSRVPFIEQKQNASSVDVNITG
jgi:hypothetical protein